VTFDTFSQLQTAAVESVDQGVEIDPSDRELIKSGSIQTTEGKLGEGDRVRLVAFLSDGTPHPNTGESVNCNLKTEANNDIHISVTERKDGSEFEGIVVEMIPQNRPAKWTSDNVDDLHGSVRGRREDRPVATRASFGSRPARGRSMLTLPRPHCGGGAFSRPRSEGR